MTLVIQHWLLLTLPGQLYAQLIVWKISLAEHFFVFWWSVGMLGIYVSLEGRRSWIPDPSLRKGVMLTAWLTGWLQMGRTAFPSLFPWQLSLWYSAAALETGKRADSERVLQGMSHWISAVAPLSPFGGACKRRRVFSNILLLLQHPSSPSPVPVPPPSQPFAAGVGDCPRMHKPWKWREEKVIPSDIIGTLPSGKPLGRRKPSWAPDK